MVKKAGARGAGSKGTKGDAGRPPHEPDESSRRLVLTGNAAGWSKIKIAAALSISVPTLDKHYFAELTSADDAKAKVEGELITMLWAMAKAGKVGAVDRLQARLGRDPAKAPKLGKKDQATADAHAANEDPEWAELLN